MITLADHSRARGHAFFKIRDPSAITGNSREETTQKNKLYFSHISPDFAIHIKGIGLWALYLMRLQCRQTMLKTTHLKGDSHLNGDSPNFDSLSGITW
jgi:hypothetical protein